MIRKFLSPPQFDDMESNTKARILNGLAWVVMGLLLATAPIIALSGYADFTLYALAGIFVVFSIALFFLKKRRVNAAAVMVAIMAWVVITVQAFTADGVRDVILIAYLAIAMLASLTISIQAAAVMLALSFGAIWSLALLQSSGVITPGLDTPMNYARDLSIMFVVIAAMIYYATTILQRASRLSQSLLEESKKSNQELEALRISLEQRIQERTVELNLSNQHNERRARQFEAVARVARATAANQNLETLLPSLAELISRHFDFYHTGIFLMDENREFAELRAANSEGGKRMLARGHKLGIGQSGIVGFVSGTGRARIALNVGDDAVFFDNPDLPDTRSEMALPLRAADQIIGVLDVQSVAVTAFQEEDIEALSTLADQVALAIQNAHSYETTQELLKEAQRASGSILRESWRVLQAGEESIGYEVSDNRLRPMSRLLESPQTKRAIASKQTVMENGERAALAVPIRLRGEVIGVMDIRAPEEHQWDTDEVDLVEAVAERLSLELESALLLKSTQRRAEIERITADISSKLGATTQFDSILRTAAEELSLALGGSEVLVQLQAAKSPDGAED